MIFERLVIRIKYSIIGHIQEVLFLVKNSHNRTRLKGMSYPHLDIKKIEVGKRTYGTLNVFMFGNESEYLKIGQYCSIGPECVFLLSGEHSLDTLTTYPVKTFLEGVEDSPQSKGQIIVEDDVWIGYGSTILSGVHIGKGAVIGACSVVVNDVPEYSIVAGNPAKLIRYRFSGKVVEKIKNIDFENVDESLLVRANRMKIDEDNVDIVMNMMH